MTKKRLLLLVVVFCLAVTVFGCTPESSEQTDSAATEKKTAAPDDSSQEAEKEKEIKTFTLFLGDNTRLVHSDLFSTPIGKKVAELTGAKLEIEYLVGGTVQQKIGIMLAAEELPDFVDGHEAHQMFIDADVLVPLEDYIAEYGTNTQKTYGSVLNRLKREDGHIYELTPYRETVAISLPNRAFWMSAKVLEENGWPMITDWSEYLRIIRDYVNAHPETNGAPTIGYSFISESWRAFTYTSPPVYLSGNPNHGIFIVDENDKAHFSPMTDYGKRFYSDLNDLWNEGLIDTEAFTQNYDQYISKLTTGRVLAFCDEFWEFTEAQQTLINEERYGDIYVPMPVVFDEIESDADNNFGDLTIRDGVSITTSCEEPLEAFKFLDALQDEEVQKLMFWGIEGEDYLLDENGRMYRDTEILAKEANAEYVERQGAGSDYWFIYPHGVGKYSDGINYWTPAEDPELTYNFYSEGEKAILDKYNLSTFAEFCTVPERTDYGLLWSVTPENGSEEANIQAKYLELAYKFIPQMIMAETKAEFESIYQKYCDENEDIGIGKYLEFMNESIQERIAQYLGE